jgi:hypothetical protein
VHGEEDPGDVRDRLFEVEVEVEGAEEPGLTGQRWGDRTGIEDLDGRQVRMISRGLACGLPRAFELLVASGLVWRWLRRC